MAQDPRAQDPRTQLAADWITIWQSEAAAMAADREMQEAWQRFSTLWAQQAAALLQAVTFDPPGRAGPAPPARSATADAASVAAAGTAGIDPRDAVIAALVERVAALERRDG